MDQDPFTGAGPEPDQPHGAARSAGFDGEAGPEYGYRRPPTAPSGLEHRATDQGAGRIRGFLEDQLRERPLPTLLLGVLAGWLAGKLLR